MNALNSVQRLLGCFHSHFLEVLELPVRLDLLKRREWRGLLTLLLVGLQVRGAKRREEKEREEKVVTERSQKTAQPDGGSDTVLQYKHKRKDIE